MANLDSLRYRYHHSYILVYLNILVISKTQPFQYKRQKQNFQLLLLHVYGEVYPVKDFSIVNIAALTSFIFTAAFLSSLIIHNVKYSRWD